MRGGLCAAGLAGRRRQPARPADLGSACGLGDLPRRTHTPRLCTTTLLTAVLDLLLASNVRAEPLCLKTVLRWFAGAESVRSLPADANHLLPHGGQFPAVPERRAIHHREGRPFDLRNPHLLTIPLVLSTLFCARSPDCAPETPCVLGQGEESFTARMDQPGGLAVPRYRHAAESIFEIQGRSRRGDA